MNLFRATLRHSRTGAIAFTFLVLMSQVAIFAPLFASDLPVAVSLSGKTFWLPCFTQPAELLGETQQTLATRAEWMVPTLVTHGPAQSLLSEAPAGQVPPFAPQTGLLFGSDEIGRDVLARLIHGTRTSLFIAGLTVLFTLIIGSLLGSLAALRGGLVDSIVLRCIEVTSALPGALLLLAVLAVTRIHSLTALALLMALLRWPDVARLLRAEVLKLKNADFVIAARSYGASEFRILRKHLLPNAAGPLLIAAVSLLASTLLLESALAFLGFGAAAPTASWGELLAQAHRNLVFPGACWLALFPGALLFATVLCAHVFAEAAQRTFDGGTGAATVSR